MGKKYIVIPDCHARPGNHNKRAEWIGNLIKDTKPDVVVNMGDTADMPSLCSYDRGKKSFQGRTYRADIEAACDFNDRLWGTVKSSKKKLPRRVFLIGNHEQRIDRAIEVQPELEGVISYEDLELDHWYDTVVPYNGSTPGIVTLDGVVFAHYLVSGVSGRPISGEHLAYSLLAKQHTSCVVGHNHTLDYCIRTRANGKRIMGLCAGVYQDYSPSFAGEASKLWWSGVSVLHNVEDGVFEPQFITIESLRKEYS